MNEWGVNLEKLFLQYLSNLEGHPSVRSRQDLLELNSKQLLEIAHALPDELLPFFVHVLKTANLGESLFQKLLGDHDEENRERVDEFFSRYEALVMGPSEPENMNPLLVYIPLDSFQDLVFLQSRERFFKSQTMECILEFLEFHFEEIPSFLENEQEKAWNWFWKQVMM